MARTSLTPGVHPEDGYPLPPPEVIAEAARAAQRKLPGLLDIETAEPRWVPPHAIEAACAPLGAWAISEQTTTGGLAGVLRSAFPRRLARSLARRLRGLSGPVRSRGARLDRVLWREVTTTLGSEMSAAVRELFRVDGITAPAAELVEGELVLERSDDPVLMIPLRLGHGGLVVDGYILWTFDGSLGVGLESEPSAPRRENLELAPARFDPTVFENTPRPSLVVDLEGRVAYANRPFSTLAGPASLEPGGLFAPALPSGAPRELGPRIEEALRRGLGSYLGPALHAGAALDKAWEVVPLPRGLGAVLHAESLADATCDEQELLARDDEIDRLRAELGRRERQVKVDAVTGLPLRGAFREQLVEVLAQTHHRGAIVLVDIDGFRDVNQTFGPEVGDDLLRTVASRTRGQLRNLSFAARVGSDEIAILLHGVVGAEEAMDAAWELVQGVAAPIRVQDRELFMSAGAGVVLFPEHGTESDVLLSHAERALEEAKRAGRGEVRLFAPSEGAVEDRLSLWSALRRAVADQDFVLHFQPQVDLRTMRPTGVEALLRWQHPERGALSPGVFVPMLEEAGLIGTVGAWVLDQACRTAVAWGQADVASMQVSVNVSARQLYSGDFVASVQRVLQETGLPADRLELEVTETLLMQDFGTSARTLAALKDLGTHVAVDDFGTGYSSLSYLKRLPVDTLKIDRAFIRELDRDAEDVAICRAIIELGHELGLTIVAEGAETRCQLERLDDLGCDVVQGFLLGRPMAEAAFRSWMLEASVRSSFPAA